MNFRRLSIASILVLSIAISSASCSINLPSFEGKHGTAKLTSSQLAVVSENKTLQDLSKKYTAYVNFYNYMQGDLYNELITYYSTMGTDPKKLEKPTVSLDLTAFDVSKVLQISNIPPSTEQIDGVAATTAPKIDEIYQLLKKINDYYSSKSSVADKQKQGLVFHAQLIALTAKFDDYITGFASVLNPYITTIHTRELAFYNDNNMPLSYNCLKFIIDLDVFDSAFRTAKLTSSNLQTIDKAKISDSYNNLQNDYSAINSNFTTAKSEHFSSSFISSAQASAKKSMTAVNDIMTRVDGKKGLANGTKITNDTAGTLENLEHTSANFVTIFNNK